jgi:hypothetical protein
MVQFSGARSLGLVLYLLEVGERLVNRPSGAVGIITIIVILAFIGGIRGAFAFHRYNKQEGQLLLTSESLRSGLGRDFRSGGLCTPNVTIPASFKNAGNRCRHSGQIAVLSGLSCRPGCPTP